MSCISVASTLVPVSPTFDRFTDFASGRYFGVAVIRRLDRIGASGVVLAKRIVMRRIYAVVVVVAFAATSEACAKRNQPVAQPSPPTVTEAPPPPPPLPASVAEPVVPSDASLTDEESFARKSLEELNAERPLGHAFFDYDSATLRAQDLSILQVNAAWLTKWPSTQITIEGHCDSRGSAEYNLALGERRAVAVRSYLASLGVSGDRLTTVSKGKEQPFCYEENENCWQQNRRGHFIITAK